MLCEVRYHLYNLKHVKNTAGVSLLVKLHPATLLKVTVLHRCFSRFLDCKNGTKPHKASHLYKYFDTHCPLLGKYIHRRLAENHYSGNNEKINK